MKKKLDNMLRKRENHAANDRWIVNMSSQNLFTPEPFQGFELCSCSEKDSNSLDDYSGGKWPERC